MCWIRCNRDAISQHSFNAKTQFTYKRFKCLAVGLLCFSFTAKQKSLLVRKGRKSQMKCSAGNLIIAP